MSTFKINSPKNLYANLAEGQTVMSIQGLCGMHLTLDPHEERFDPSNDVACFDTVSTVTNWVHARAPFEGGYPCIECISNISEELYDYLIEAKCHV